MRFVSRAIAAGILIGAALFFIPFLFGFVFFVILAFFVVRVVARPRRYGGRWGSGYYDRRYFAGGSDDNYTSDIVPIDGSRYSTSVNRKADERQFPVL